MSDQVLHVGDTDFEAQVLKSDTPVLVDFWAEWCGPCRAIAPSLEDMSKDMAGKVTIAKVNIDENPGIASKYQIRSIPTLMLFKDGKPVATRMGSLPKQALYQWVEQTIA